MKSFVEESSFFEGNDPEEIVQAYGTPLYVYNERILRDRMRAVGSLITKYPYTANYSMKANSNLTILRIAKEEGISCDAMSEGELRLLEAAGMPPERIFFVPNNISEAEFRYAIDRNIMVSVDSLDQLALFGRLHPCGEVSVRVNPGVGAGHHQKVITAGKETKFGVAPEDVAAVTETAEKYGLRIVGINQHVGSHFMGFEPYKRAVENLLEMAKRFRGLKFIDFGGGFGIPYHKLDGEAPFDIRRMHDELEPVLTAFVEEYGYAPLFKSEPGRYCVAESSVILGRVYAKKQNAGRIYAGTDVGMNVLARPTLYDAWHDVEILRNGVAVTEGERERVTITGNICESGDMIAKDRELPVIRDGDLICVLDTGAYGYSMCYNYNTRRRPAELLIRRDGSLQLIRRRETFEDLMAFFGES